MELCKQVFPSGLAAFLLDKATYDAIHVLVETQSLDCSFWCGLLLYYGGTIWVIVRDDHTKYELIELDYISEF